MIKVIQDFTPKTTPLPHQVEAIAYLTDNPHAALFDEQGLGKTKIVIDALCHVMDTGEVDAVLIVAPLSLVHTWEYELSKHSHLYPVVLRGSEREKRYRLLTGANFYIINYEAIVAETERMVRFCKSRKVAIVLDEAARVKDPRTRTAQALFQLAPLALRRIIVTGTPVANKPVDLWAQFFFLDQGKLLGTSFEGFCALYDEKHPDYLTRLSELREVISQHSIRRTKENVLELPEKVFQTVFVELMGRQSELYARLREELQIEVTALDGSTIIAQVDTILEKLLRLVQLASNPALLDHSFSETPAKFAALDQIVANVIEGGEKLIVWSCFVDNVLALKNRYAKHKPLVIHGQVPVASRTVSVRRFQEDCVHQIMIANPAAAREGLTLTRANHAVYVDRNFSLVDYLQSQDRIHRISQTKRCTIWKVLAQGTIDEYVDRILEMKTSIAKFLESDFTEVHQNALETLWNKQQLLQVLGG